MKPVLLGTVCVIVLCVIFSLGLWPFHGPVNQVIWLKSSDGVALGKYGTLLGAGKLENLPSLGIGGSVEIWAQPYRRRQSATMLALYQPSPRVLFTLRQSLADLEIYAEADGKAKAHFYCDDVLGPALRQGQSVFITVTSGQSGILVYRDGSLIKSASRLFVPEDAFTGRLIVGDSPGQPDSFRGQVRGVAIYGTELNASQVLRHYTTWTTRGSPEIVRDENNRALYLFNERSGDVVHNRSAEEPDLRIPTHYSVVDKIALEPFWAEFDFSASYWRGNLKNVVGFLPVGFCFYAFVIAVRPRTRAVLITVTLGFFVSLAIEVLQIFLPTRDSGTTDLITNTFGTYLGVTCYRRIYRVIAKRFPILDWMLVTEAQPESNSKHLENC